MNIEANMMKNKTIRGPYNVEPTNEINTTITTTAVETNKNISSKIEKNNVIKLPLPKRLLENQTQSKLNILDIKIIKPPPKLSKM